MRILFVSMGIIPKGEISWKYWNNKSQVKSLARIELV